MHSAHSLLSSFGILTILPTHASSLSPSFLSSLTFLSFLSLCPLLPSPLSLYFSTDFVCKKRVSVKIPENLLLPKEGQKLDLEWTAARPGPNPTGGLGATTNTNGPTLDPTLL